MTEEVESSFTDQQLPTHSFVDHPSELVLQVRARTFAELAGEAVSALATILEHGMEFTGKTHVCRFVVEGIDRGAMLVNLLNEVISRAEANLFVPTGVETHLSGAASLDVSLSGKHVFEAPSLVKAATLHNLHLADRDGKVDATVTFDI